VGTVEDVTHEQRSHQAVVDATAVAEATMQAQRVPVNVYESAGAVVVVAPLPAVTVNDVTVELDRGTLRFWAHLRSAAPREYLVREWEYGGYASEIDIPDGYGSGLEASLANGQLAIRVLRGEPSSSRISIQPVSL
jgi:HSP20 family molecular chaperone IbpA